MYSEEVFEAAERNDLERVKMFIESGGIRPTITRGFGRETLAHIAVREGYLDMIKYLLEKDTSLLKMDFHGYMLGDSFYMGPCTLLDMAVEKGYLQIVKYLVENQNADIYQVFHYDYTAINWAVINGHLNITKYFIEERNVDVNKPPVRYSKFKPLLFDAVYHKNRDIVTYFIEERKADLTLIDCKNENILFTAVREGNLNFVKYILDEKKADIDINWKNGENRTLLHEAASKFSEVGLLKYLIGEKHADINITAGKNNWTPLHYAVKESNLDCVEYLVDCGANIDKKDVNGDTPLHLAASRYLGKSGYEICKYLCEHGAYVSQKNNENKTPLDIVLSQNRIGQTIRILFEYGADINWKNENGDTLVHIAATKNEISLLDYVVRGKHLDVNSPRKRDGWTPLHCAAFWNHLDICKYLIEHGANIRAEDKCNKTPIQVASSQDVFDYIKNVSLATRNRRSVKQYSPMLLQNRTHQREFTHQRIAGNVVGSAIPFLRDNTLFGWQIFFTYIDLLIRYFVRNPANFSPDQRQDSLPTTLRLDPIAEDAVRHLPEFINQ